MYIVCLQSCQPFSQSAFPTMCLDGEALLRRPSHSLGRRMQNAVSGSTFTRMYFPLFCALIHIIIAFISDLFTFDDYLSSIKQAKKMLSIKLKAWVKQVQAVLCLHKLK